MNSFILRRINSSLYSLSRLSIKLPNNTYLHSIAHFNQFSFQQLTSAKSNDNKYDDYDTLLECVNPEIAKRIKQLLNQKSYVQSLSDQILQKQEYHQQIEQKQIFSAKTNYELTNEVIEELNKEEQKEQELINQNPSIQYEPGLNLYDLSLLTNKYSSFYGKNPLNGFEDFGDNIIDKYLIKALNDMGYDAPSHIQQLAIPQILTDNNCVIGAETGTGKTLAYLIPLLQKLLHDDNIINSDFDPITKFNPETFGQTMGETETDTDTETETQKYHTFEFDAEKKYPTCVILQPSEHLCIQVELIINELLDRYYSYYYSSNSNDWDSMNKYRLKTMCLHGHSLLPRSNDQMIDILLTTPTALNANIHRKHGENKSRSFLSKIKYIVLDEADLLTRGNYRYRITYLFANLKELQSQIQSNPLKYKLLIPKFIRNKEISSSSYVYNELSKIGKPQMIFVGATIPTAGKNNVADTIREWLDKAVWIRTPGLHEVCSHIAQEFRYVPHGMELEILNHVLISIVKDNLQQQLFKNQVSNEDLLMNENTNVSDNLRDDSGLFRRHKKRKKRDKKIQNNKLHEFEDEQKRLRILIFFNTKTFARHCMRDLLEKGWFNTRCIHNDLHREERKLRLNNFNNFIPCERSGTIIKDNLNNKEYIEVVDNVHILISSDFSSRGTDFKNVDIIINAEFPKYAIDYLHRCGRTGRGDYKQFKNGKVISFFNEYNLDLAWHIQMSLINRYKQILNEFAIDDKYQHKQEDFSRIGTTSVRLSDCFGGQRQSNSMNNIVKDMKGFSGYQKMSKGRDFERKLDLTRVDLDEMDDGLVEFVINEAKRRNWISGKHKDDDNDHDKSEKENKKPKQSSKDELKALIEQKRKENKSLKIPQPQQLEFVD